MDDRIKVIQKSNVFCRICLRLLGMEAGASSRGCGAGKHIIGNGRNMSCTQPDCESNVTLCRRHEKINAEKHKTYKAALCWKQWVTRGQPQDDQEDYAYLITVPEETETKCTAILDDMDQTRKGIHLNHGSDMGDIFACYPTELRKGNNEVRMRRWH